MHQLQYYNLLSVSVFSLISVSVWLQGSGQVSVLSQALGGACHSYKLEFVVRNAEELSAVEEELKACDDGTSLHCSGNRLCEHSKTSAQECASYIFLYKKPKGFCTFARFTRGKITLT